MVSSWKTGKDSGATTCSKAAGARAEEGLVVLEEEEEEVLAGADAAIAACVVDSEDGPRDGNRRTEKRKSEIRWDIFVSGTTITHLHNSIHCA